LHGADAKPLDICTSFTYNTNALYRILSQLASLGLVPRADVDNLLDSACLLLTRLYRFGDGFLLRNINNNFNMYLITKVIEFLVGTDRYNTKLQELESTRRSLSIALSLASAHFGLSTKEKMGVAVGAGVAFIESRLRENGTDLSRNQSTDVQEVSYRSYGRKLALDHREVLFNLIEEKGGRQGSFILAVILDDATETVDDLLWIQDLIEKFSFLKVNALVNTAQISVNFSIHMIDQVLRTDYFAGLRSSLGDRLLITETFCPFISFQTNYLPTEARRVVDASDAVYVKGANFFETCQLLHKDSFHGFVVYGNVSRKYTGLKDFDSVFAYVPAGTAGTVITGMLRKSRRSRVLYPGVSKPVERNDEFVRGSRQPPAFG
jgi:hypothetical protein